MLKIVLTSNRKQVFLPENWKTMERGSLRSMKRKKDQRTDKFYRLLERKKLETENWKIKMRLRFKMNWAH